jgi:hypothetical protein
MAGHCQQADRRTVWLYVHDRSPTILRLLRPVVGWLRWALPQISQLPNQTHEFLTLELERATGYEYPGSGWSRTARARKRLRACHYGHRCCAPAGRGDVPARAACRPPGRGNAGRGTGVGGSVARADVASSCASNPPRPWRGAVMPVPAHSPRTRPAGGRRSLPATGSTGRPGWRSSRASAMPSVREYTSRVGNGSWTQFANQGCGCGSCAGRASDRSCCSR